MTAAGAGGRATSPASSEEEEEWRGEAMAAEEEVGTNGISREDLL
jgi:hypothetical protein